MVATVERKPDLTEFQVFVSCCPEDTPFAEMLATELESAGITPILRAWELVAGASVTEWLDNAMGKSESAVIVVGPGAIASTAEYHVLASLFNARRLKRLVPVLMADGLESQLPPGLVDQEPRNFADAIGDHAEFERRATELADSLCGRRRRGSVEVELTGPEDFRRMPAGPVRTTLRIGADETALTADGQDVATAVHEGMTAALRGALRAMDRARSATDRMLRAAAPALSHVSALDLDEASRATGRRLSEAFLGPVADVVRSHVERAERAGRVVHLALEVDNDLVDLPWECLLLPGDDTPLCLRPSIRLHRQVSGLGATAQPSIEGPLRVLAVIASPDAGGGELLDYEQELKRILDEVEGARRDSGAYVRILNWGSLAAIRRALVEEQFHVLHVSCHARPGELLLESEDGGVHLVTAADFADTLVGIDNRPPLVVLAGCSTARAGRAASLPSVGRTLLARGVPAVLAMNDVVSDDYATEMLAQTYQELAAQRDAPDPLVAVANARREMERQRRDLPVGDRGRLPAEWATPAYFQRVRHHILFRPGQYDTPPTRQDRGLLPGIVDLETGDFVGRRPELRRLTRIVRDGGGVLIHGMGGVGKSSLASQIVHFAHGDGAALLILHGRHTVDKVLQRLAKCLANRPGISHQAVLDLTNEAEEWDERLRDFAAHVLPKFRQNVLLVLDDPIGDPLSTDGEHVRPEQDMGEFLKAWLALGRQARLIVTTRHREPLADDVGRRLVTHHLGPLSAAETRKLIFRLPAVDRLSPADQERAHHDLGGHPRALEYLDAVLRGGAGELPARKGTGAQFEAVMDRIDKALKARGQDKQTWRRERTFDAALAETITIVAADVLLRDLHSDLTASFPLAAELLVAASVYRVPVNADGLTWAVATSLWWEDQQSDTRDRLAAVYQVLRDGRGLPQDAHDQLIRDLAAIAHPPERAGLPAARDRLLDLTLLSPVWLHPDDGGPPIEQFQVHRWTAKELSTHVDPAALVTAHTQAAAYHRVQAQLWERDPMVQLEWLEECRHHSWAAGQPAQAVAVTAGMCSVLDRLGWHDRELSLCEDVLARIGADDPDSRFFHQRMSVIALRRVDLPGAQACQHKALALARAADDELAMASGWQQLGTIAQLRGDNAAAEDAYHRAMAIVRQPSVEDRIDALVILAGCYQRLGGLALGRGDDDSAERFSIGALNLADDVADEAENLGAHAEFGALAAAVGDQHTALHHGLVAQEMAAADLDVRRLVAAASLQLGTVCLTKRLLDEAWEHLDRAGTLAEDVRDTPLYASCLQLLGEVQIGRRDYEDALATYEEFVEFADALDDPRGQVVAHQQLGRIHATLGDPDGADEALSVASAISERLGNDLLLGTTRLAQGGVLAGSGDLDRATDRLREGFEIAERIGEQGLALACLVQLALVRLRLDDLTAAEGLFEDGRRRAGRLGSARSGATCLLALGLIARARARDAAPLYEAALDLAEQDHNPRLEAECLARLGDIALDREANTRAEDLYRRCLDLLGTASAPLLRADVLRQIGRCRLYRGEPRRAAETFTEAVEAFTVLEQPTWVLYCLVCLAWVLPRAGRPNHATGVKGRARDIDLAAVPARLAVAGLLLAGEHAAETGEPDAARDYFRKALDRARDIDEPQLVIDSARHLARLAVDHGDLRKARPFAEFALDTAVHVDDRVLTMHLRRELGVIIAGQGDQAKADRVFDRSAEDATALHDGNARLAALALAGRVSVDRLDERLAALEDDFAEIMAARQVRAVDAGEVFDDRMAAYAGVPIDEIVTDLVPQFSGVSAVPAVVSPSVTSVSRRPPGPVPPRGR
jgi:tetratricopeptide (TPR) repeat protein